MDYTEELNEKFKDLNVEIVNFDNGGTPESMAAYILVSDLTKGMVKDKGDTVLDVGNWLYRRFGLMYENPPEYHRRQEPKNSLAFYISKKTMDRMPKLKEYLVKTYNLTHSKEPVKRYESALYRNQRFLIQGDSNKD